jgi:hypothetical protein
MTKKDRLIAGTKEMLASPHIHIALATGISIIVLAYVSKRVLPEPMGKLPMAIPPFLMVIWEAVSSKHRDLWISRPGYWIAAIFATTGLVILFHAM